MLRQLATSAAVLGTTQNVKRAEIRRSITSRGSRGSTAHTHTVAAPAPAAATLTAQQQQQRRRPRPRRAVLPSQLSCACVCEGSIISTIDRAASKQSWGEFAAAFLNGHSEWASVAYPHTHTHWHTKHAAHTLRTQTFIETQRTPRGLRKRGGCEQKLFSLR